MGNNIKNNNMLHFTYEPTLDKKNIDYAFQRLVLPLISATGFMIYKESHQEYKEILGIVMKWIILYTNTKDLANINCDEFFRIKEKITELDNKYLSSDGLYAEESYIWIIQLEILLEKAISERKKRNTLQ